MSLEFVRKLPTPTEIREQYPLSARATEIKKQRDAEIAKVFTGDSDKFLVIVGPCSADNEDAVLEYNHRLAKVADEVSDKLIYTNKPRTTGEGYKGIVHQPDPEGKPDLLHGLIAMRKMHMRVVEETDLTSADEMLYPSNWSYLSDILSYVAVGARSVENQEHRLTVSGIDIPAGMKNPTSGDFSVMMNSITAAQSSHMFIYRNWEVVSKGNPYAHAILRGYMNKKGQSLPNYHYEDLKLVCDMYHKAELQNPAIIVDVNHANSGKKYLEQIRISKEVLQSRTFSEDVHDMVKGLMIESYLADGNQPVNGTVYGQSITDPCLGWDKTERLIRELAEMV